MNHKYYILVESTERRKFFSTTVTDGMVVELSQPLSTEAGIAECMNWLRDTLQLRDAVLRWWTKLEG